MASVSVADPAWATAPRNFFAIYQRVEKPGDKVPKLSGFSRPSLLRWLCVCREPYKTRHLYSTLKRGRNGRFHIVSTCNTRDVFVGRGFAPLH